jgi:hypothetical protein
MTKKTSAHAIADLSPGELEKRVEKIIQHLDAIDALMADAVELSDEERRSALRLGGEARRSAGAGGHRQGRAPGGAVLPHQDRRGHPRAGTRRPALRAARADDPGHPPLPGLQSDESPGRPRRPPQPDRGREAGRRRLRRRAAHREGQGRASLVNVAAIHEFGSRPIVLKLTPKARRFLHAAFRAAGLDAPAGDRPSTGIAVIKIPARPFLRPVFEKHAGDPAEVSRRFLDRVATNLGGDFGG